MNRHPPKPLPVLAVGVIGHRPNRLPVAARAKLVMDVGNVFDAIASELDMVRQRYGEFFEGRPLLSLIGSLAEGADRIAAEAAIERGWALDVNLPFSANDYEADFETPESRAEFRRILGQSRSVLTLPGSRDSAPHAYELAGMTILNRCDVLVGVWDGGSSAGRGGTTDLLTLAARTGIPIIHIDAKAESATRLLWRGLRDAQAPINVIEDCPHAEFAAVFPLVDELVRPPLGAFEQTSLQSYLQEKVRGHNLRLEFSLLMTAHRVRSVQKADLLPPAPEVLAAERIADAEPAKGGDLTSLALAYGWADAIGVRFAQTFRSAFVLNFVFAAGAVVLAAASLFLHQKLWFVIPEIGLIVAVIVNTSIGRRRRWHQRWLEARELAERLRVAHLLWLLGSRPANFFSGEEPTWTGWYARAVVRAQPPRSGSLADDGLSAAWVTILTVLRKQSEYHVSNRLRMHQLDYQLEEAGFWLLLGTLGAAGLYVLYALLLWIFNPPIMVEYHELVKQIVVAITAALPALATATYGIRVIGDFEGIARRSDRTRSVLDRLVKAMERDPVDLITLRAQAQTAADAMLGDVASWRLAVESRVLAIPG